MKQIRSLGSKWRHGENICGVTASRRKNGSVSRIRWGTAPVPDYVLRELLQAAGFQEVTRYIGAFLVEGWFAVKA
ncbi:hypothetical protein [Paenibacillus sp. cl141a]|uniref:hypothetical protein n=1 Tax=Paenibacillus sp. cl141a TaxID=1761877 RepID=UPI0020C90161|nr:hypothetical protein [Paenibacillus sp. cl141a]